VVVSNIWSSKDRVDAEREKFNPQKKIWDSNLAEASTTMLLWRRIVRVSAQAMLVQSTHPGLQPNPQGLHKVIRLQLRLGSVVCEPPSHACIN